MSNHNSVPVPQMTPTATYTTPFDWGKLGQDFSTYGKSSQTTPRPTSPSDSYGGMRPESTQLQDFILKGMYGNEGATPEERANLAGQRNEMITSGTSDINAWLKGATGNVRRNMLGRGMDKSSTELYGMGNVASEGTRQIGQLTSKANSDFFAALNKLPMERRSQAIQMLHEMMQQQARPKSRKGGAGGLLKSLLPMGAGLLANTFAPGSGPIAAGLAGSLVENF